MGCGGYYYVALLLAICVVAIWVVVGTIMLRYC